MEARPPGRIVTFYSYKGGTGRSLALATTAWILAANGKRVLALDWDLEAPGLHRYFKPFLIDKGLTSSEGIIDFVSDFADAVVGPVAEGESLPADWYVEHADLSPYVLSVDYRGFPAGGKLDLVPAGRQGPTYAVRVNSFDWKDFYDRLGGGAFLEAAKAKLRQDYDYVLVDSRTGVSDTAGICTVQMPDVLAVCFTYNNQSIEGAAAVARSAEQERRRLRERAAAGPLPDDLVVFPVPTRVDQSEQEKLRLRQAYSREVFDGFLQHLDAPSGGYWVDVEVPYLPFMAYEEVLPVFTDDPRDSKKPLAAMIRLTGYLTGLPISAPGLEIEDGRKQEILREYAATPSTAREEPRSAPAAATPEAEEKQLGAEAALLETEELVRWRREIQPLLKAWSANPEDRRTLLRGPLLTVSRRWFRVAGQSLKKNERIYILESLEDQKRRQLAAWRGLAVLLALAAVALLAALGAETRSQGRRQRALITALAAVDQGKKAAESRDYDQAIDHFNRALSAYREAGREGPEAEAAYVDLALVRIKQGDSAAALNALGRALHLQPDDPVALMERGNLERDQGATQEALADYNRALQLNQGYAEAYLNRGRARANAQPPDLDGAIADYRQAIEKKSDLVEAHYYLGVAYHKKGDDGSAAYELQVAAEQSKDPAVSVPAKELLQQLPRTTTAGSPGVEAGPAVATPRIFLQYRDRADAPVLDAVTNRLTGNRFNVQGKELRGEATQGDIRYYYPSDKQNAEAAKESVEKALEAKGHPLKLRTLDLSGTYRSVAPGTIEVWLPSLSKPRASVEQTIEVRKKQQAPPKQ